MGQEIEIGHNLFSKFSNQTDSYKVDKNPINSDWFTLVLSV